MAQLYINILNSHRAINIARSYTRRHRAGTVGMVVRLLQPGKFCSFFLKDAINVALCTLSGRSFQILGELKAKLFPKCLTDLQREEWKGRVTTPSAVGETAH